MRPGLLQGLAGIYERRWWDEGTTFGEAAAMAGGKALTESGIDPSRTGLMINTSVTRQHLEPSAAVEIHHLMGLPTSCVNFDLANACLGFVNAMHLAATMIDSGSDRLRRGWSGERRRRCAQERALDRLSRPDATSEDLQPVRNADARFPVPPRWSSARPMHTPAPIVGASPPAATEHHKLCIGDLENMTTDSKGLDAGVALAEDAWAAATEHDWADMDCYVIGPGVRGPHPARCAPRLGIDESKVPMTFPLLGNIGPASVPVTLAAESEHARTRCPSPVHGDGFRA